MIFNLGMGSCLTGELGASSTAACSWLESLLLLESLEPELELLELELELLLELLEDLEGLARTGVVRWKFYPLFATDEL